MALTLPNMGVKVWNLPTDPYDSQQLADNWARVDNHDHTPGKGVQVPTAGIQDSAITAAKIAPGAISTLTIPDGAVSTNKIVDGAVTTAKILDGTIVDADVNPAAAIDGTKLASNSVSTLQIGTLPKARVYHSASQSIVNATGTKLNFNSERWDSDTIHDTVTNNTRLTCKTAGLYLIQCNVDWAAAGSGHRGVALILNGATSIAEIIQSAAEATALAERQIVTTVYQLAVNDYVEAQVFQSSGANLQVLATPNMSPEFSMCWLSD